MLRRVGMIAGWILVSGWALAEPSKLEDHYSRTPATVGQFSDVTPGHESYTELQILVERYGVGFGLADGKFHGEMALTRGEMAYFLLQAMEKMDKMAGALPYKNEWPAYSLNPGARPQWPGDLKAAQPYYSSVRKLLKTYHIHLTDSDGRFHGQRPASEREVFACLRGIFHYRRSHEKLDSSRPLTRWEMAHALSDAVDDYYMFMVEQLEERP